MDWTWTPRSFYAPTRCTGIMRRDDGGDADDAGAIDVTFVFGERPVADACARVTASLSIDVAGYPATLSAVETSDPGHVGVETLSYDASKAFAFRLVLRPSDGVTVVLERSFRVTTGPPLGVDCDIGDVLCDLSTSDDVSFDDASSDNATTGDGAPAPGAENPVIQVPPLWQRIHDALNAGDVARLADAPVVRAAEWLLQRGDVPFCERDAEQRAHVELRPTGPDATSVDPIVIELSSKGSRERVRLPVAPGGRLTLAARVERRREVAFVRGVESRWEADPDQEVSIKLTGYDGTYEIERAKTGAHGRASLDVPLSNALSKSLWITGGCGCTLVMRWGRPVEAIFDEGAAEPAPLPDAPDADALAAACATDLARHYDLDEHVFRVGDRTIYGGRHDPAVGWLLALVDFPSCDEALPESVGLWRALAAGPGSAELPIKDRLTRNVLGWRDEPTPPGHWSLSITWPLVEALARGGDLVRERAFADAARDLAKRTRLDASPWWYCVGKVDEGWFAERVAAHSQSIAAATLLRAGAVLDDEAVREAGAALLEAALPAAVDEALPDLGDREDPDSPGEARLAHHLAAACGVAVACGLERFAAPRATLLDKLWRDAREAGASDPVRRLGVLGAMREGFLWYF